jgi:hypothetical protein
VGGNPITAALVALTDENVRFVVCGGVACILQGVARATHDLDLRVALDDSDLAGVLRVATALGLTPRIPEPLEALLDPARRRSWIEDKNAVVYTLLSARGDFAVDIFLVYPIGYDELASRADHFEIEGRDVLVSSKQDLVTAKRSVFPPRTVDVRDIADLEDLLRG